MHQREEVRHTPMLGDLAIVHTHGVNGIEMDLPARRRDAQKLPFMRTVIGLERGHDLAVGCLPVDDGVKIRKCRL